MDEYISVAEFAQLAHKSSQAIYKQLNNRLNPYIKLVDNQRMLNIRALTEIYGIEVEQPIQPSLTTNSTQESTNISATAVAIDALTRQLEEKDKQIETLHKLLEQQSRLLEQQNGLALADKKAILQLSGDQDGDDQQPEEPRTATAESDKFGFFDRLRQLFK